jgi:hypothetical protein
MLAVEGGSGMKMLYVVAALAISVPAAFGEDGADRAKLTGAWQEQGSQAVWTIEQTSSGMHVTNSEGARKIAEFNCDLAKECEAKDAGKKVKVTLYFNGGKLVVMETRGDQVVKRRFGFGDAPDVLELEMIPVTPEGKAETMHCTRVQSASVTKP